MKKYNIFKKFSLFLLFLFVFSLLATNQSFAQDPNDTFGGQAVQSIEGLSDERTGLMPCNPFSSSVAEQCHPKDVIYLLKTLFRVSLYLVIIGLFLMLITAGLGYVFNKKSPDYLNKMRKYIGNTIVALIIIIVALGLVLGILAATGFQTEILKFLKEIFANNNNNNFSFFQQASAQTLPKLSTDTSGAYISFFPNETIGTLILKIIKVATTYVIGPALVLATIYAGFLFVKAQGKPNELNDAKKFAYRLAIFILITAAAATVVTVLLNTLNDVNEKVKNSTSTGQIIRNLDIS